MKYICYCRKSMESEDRQVLSIESQRKEIERVFGKNQDIEIIDILEEAKSAKTPGRPIFEQMLKRIAKGEAGGIVTWHPDRLARNSVDGGQIIYLLDKGVIKDLKFVTSTFENNSQGKFMLSIIFGYSKYYVDNLSENVRRGNRTKLQNGWLPHHPPIGYATNPQTRTIVPDPDRFPLVRRIWDLILTETSSPRQAFEMAGTQLGLRTRKAKRQGGKALSLNGIYKLLGNPFYAGMIVWDGRTYSGKHQPMVSIQEFEKVQAVLGRSDRPRQKQHSFCYRGLIKCGECGFAITAEEKINHYGFHYIYYRCTHKRRDYHCKQPAIPRDELENQIGRFIDQCTIPPDYFDWALNHLQKYHEAKRKNQGSVAGSLKMALKESNSNLDRLTDLRIRDLVSDEEFVIKRQKLLQEQLQLQQQLQKGTDIISWIEPSRDLLLFIRNVGFGYRQAKDSVKRGIVSILGSNFTLRDGKVSIEAQKPFFIRPANATFALMWAFVKEVRTLQQTDSNFRDLMEKVKTINEAMQLP